MRTLPSAKIAGRWHGVGSGWWKGYEGQSSGRRMEATRARVARCQNPVRHPIRRSVRGLRHETNVGTKWLISSQDAGLTTKSFVLPGKLTVLGKDHIRVTLRADPFVADRKSTPQSICNLAPRNPAGQRYSHRFFVKLIRPACAYDSSPLLHNM